LNLVKSQSKNILISKNGKAGALYLTAAPKTGVVKPTNE